MLAVAGGTWVAFAKGSAFCRHTKSAPRISYLYLFLGPTSGTNSSHTPVAPSERIGWPRPSQKLKSPTTRMPCALGAHTEKETPFTPAP